MGHLLPHLVLLLAPLAVHLAPQTRFQSSFPVYQQVRPYQDFYQPVYNSQGGYQGQQANYQGQQIGYQVGQGVYQTGQTGYQMGHSGYQSAPLYPAVGYNNYQEVQTYPEYTSYPQQQATYYQNYYTGGQSQPSYQDPVFNYMLNDLSYFGPKISSSKSFASSTSSSSPSSSLSSGPTSTSPSPTEPRPAWQGRVAGIPSTRCHDGTLLPFRARCDKKVECEQGEDEYDCDWHKNSSITTITGVKGLEQVLREEENVVVEFFAPWCPACVTFLPELEKVAETSRDIPLTVVKVNTDEDPELKELFKVDTYPRVLLWSKKGEEGPTYMYSGYKTYQKSSGLKFDNVNSWLRRQL